MSPQLRGIGFTGPQQQRGAIGLMAAVTLGMVLLFMLLVVDSGRLYLEQRKLQRVADMAVLEAVSRGGNCLDGSAKRYVDASAGRNGFALINMQTITPICGSLTTGVNQVRDFHPSKDDSGNIIQVTATTIVPTSVAGGLWSMFTGEFDFSTSLSASAVGSNLGSPLAMLTIRSSLGTIDSTKSNILNAVIGGLLGGELTFKAVSWQGIVDTNISLLSYLNQLSSDLELTVGDYDQLLTANVSPTQLITAAATVIAKDGPAARVIANNILIIADSAKKNQTLKLGDILNIKNGTPSAGLDSTLKVFDLIQTFAQLAGKNSATLVNSDISIPKVANIRINLRVIEPPQLSSIGNPALAKADPAGPNRIFVRTAQVRVDINIKIPFFEALSQITSALSDLLSPATKLVNNLLNLKLTDILSDVLCFATYCEKTKLTIASDVDIHLESASAESYVFDYNCSNNATKSLTISASTSLVKLSIGAIPPDTPQPTKNDNTKPTIDVNPIKLISFNTASCSILYGCKPYTSAQLEQGGSLSLKVQTSVGARSGNLLYSAPDLRNINETTYYKSLSSTKILDSLGGTLEGVQLATYAPKTGNTGTGTSSTVTAFLDNIKKTLVTAIQEILSPLLDPIVDGALNALGIKLGNAEVGANLSCGQGGRAQLVL